MGRVITTLSDFIQSIFRRHEWVNIPSHLYDGMEIDRSRREYHSMPLDTTRCKRCGEEIPIGMDYIDMARWQGGCRGEKQLLINELKRRGVDDIE